MTEERPAAPGPALWLRRGVGLLLVLLVLLPLYRLLAGTSAVAAREVVAAADGYYVGLWKESALVLVAATLLALVVGGERSRRWVDRCRSLLTAPSSGAFAAAAGLLAALVTGWVVVAVTGGQPVLTDAHAQLLQARYLAEGALAGPTLEAPEFRVFQFTLSTPAGWVSQYPPGHSLVLAAGLAAGALRLVPPVLAGLAAALAVPVAERLLSGDRAGDLAVARLGALLVAASPFLAGLAGTFMNHATAALLAVLTAWLALRATDGSPAWAVAAGLAVGALVATRPLSGLVVGSAVTLGTWAWVPARPGGEGRHGGGGDVRGPRRRDGGVGSGRVVSLEAHRRGGRLPPRQIGLRAGLALLGALPPGLALALYNARFFGGPFQFGYTAGTGPRHGLGFHLDPWGNPYGPAQALGYTSADLLALGRDLLGTPIPLVVVVGLFLLLARRLRPGVRVLAAWALLPVAAQALYWHHDLVLGPRMLGEAAPAWALLGAIAAVDLARRAGPARRPGRGFSPRIAVAWALLLALGVGLLWSGPRRLVALGERALPAPVPAPPLPGGEDPSPEAEGAPPKDPDVVFVHEGWGDRLGARLVALGLRLDSVRTLLRETPPCRLQSMLDAGAGVAGGGAAGVGGEVEGGARDAETECRRQAASDRFGSVGLPALIWQGELPGAPSGERAWVRDLGPELNRALLEREPDRTPGVLLPPADGPRPLIVPYERGMEILWGDSLTSALPPAGAPRAGSGAGAWRPSPGRVPGPGAGTPTPSPTRRATRGRAGS